MDVAMRQSLWEDAECCEVTGQAGKLALRKDSLFACARGWAKAPFTGLGIRFSMLSTPLLEPFLTLYFAMNSSNVARSTSTTLCDAIK
jgi:hypothetical protein